VGLFLRECRAHFERIKGCFGENIGLFWREYSAFFERIRTLFERK